MSTDKPNKQSIVAFVVIVAIIALALLVLVFKSDDCFGDPEPEPVPCSGEHCPVSSETTTGAVLKDSGDAEGDGDKPDDAPAKIEAVPSK